MPILGGNLKEEAAMNAAEIESKGLSLKKLLVINLLIGTFIGFANGSALVLFYIRKSPALGSELMLLAVILLVVALLIIVLSGFALVRVNYRRIVLSCHTIILGIMTLAYLYWALHLIFIPPVLVPGIRFIWSVGWLTVFSAYSIYLCQRVAPQFLFGVGNVRYLYLYGGVFAFVIDVATFLSLASHLRQ